MIPKTISYKELRSSRINYNHTALGIEVQLEAGETPEDILKCMKAFIELNVGIGELGNRIAEARHILSDSNFDKESYNYKEAERIIGDNADLIEMSRRIEKRAVRI